MADVIEELIDRVQSFATWQDRLQGEPFQTPELGETLHKTVAALRSLREENKRLARKNNELEDQIDTIMGRPRRDRTGDACDHDWADAAKGHVSGGKICLKCLAIRATPPKEDANA